MAARTPQKRAARKTPYPQALSQPSTPSLPSSTTNTPSGTPGPVTRGHGAKKWEANGEFRDDPIFHCWKVLIAKSENLMTFVYDPNVPNSGYLDVVPYPIDHKGQLVLPADLPAFLEKYSWELPECICAIRDGISKKTKFIVPRKVTSPAYNDLCIVCVDASCPYFVNLVDLTLNNDNLTTDFCVPHTRFQPDVETPTMPKRAGKPPIKKLQLASITRPSIKVEPKTTKLDVKGKGKQVVSAKVKTEEFSIEDVFKSFGNKPGDSDSESSQSTPHGSIDGNSKSFGTEPGSSQAPTPAQPRQNVASGRGVQKSSRKKTAARSKAATFWKDIRTNEHGADMPYQKSVETVLRLLGEGVPYEQLVGAIFLCKTCNKVMVQKNRLGHSCISDASDSDIVFVGSSSTTRAPGPAVESDSEVEFLD